MINSDLLIKHAGAIIKECQDKLVKMEHDQVYFKGAIAGVQELLGRLDNDSDISKPQTEETIKADSPNPKASRKKTSRA
jgi:hypothetical protein